MPVLGTRGAIAAGAYEPKSIGAPYWASSLTLPTNGKLLYPTVNNTGGMFCAMTVMQTSAPPIPGTAYIDPNGNVVWQKKYDIGSSFAMENSRITSDAENNTYNLCRIFSSVNYFIIYKLDQYGNLVWQNKYDFGNSYWLFEGFKASQIENILYITGVYSNGTDSWLQVIRINTNNGSIKDQASLYNTSTNGIVGVDIVPSKINANVYYVAGRTSVGSSKSECFLAKYSGTTLQWQTRISNPRTSSVYNVYDFFFSVAVDNYDNVYATGQYGVIKNVSGTDYALDDGIVTKYNSSGTLLWQKLIANNINSGVANTNAANSTLDRFGNLYAACLNYSSEDRTAIIKFNTDGTVNFSKVATPPTYVGSTDTSSNVYLYAAANQLVSPYNAYRYILKFQNDNSAPSSISVTGGTIIYVTDSTTFSVIAGTGTPTATTYTTGTNAPITVTGSSGTLSNTSYTATVTFI
jgi:hypothetical protein